MEKKKGKHGGARPGAGRKKGVKVGPYKKAEERAEHGINFKIDENTLNLLKTHQRKGESEHQAARRLMMLALDFAPMPGHGGDDER